MPGSPKPIANRVLLVQWAGDYREASQRLASGGAEHYYAQRHSIESAGQLAEQYAAYGVLCLTGTERYDAVMPDGVRAMGAAWNGVPSSIQTPLDLIAGFRPTHIVMVTPQLEIMKWAIARGIDLLPLFADTLSLDLSHQSLPRRFINVLKHFLFCRRLAKILADPRIRWVSNHNINACRNLVQLGVAPGKVVPWDWPPAVRPDSYEAKALDASRDAWNLVFVGMITPSKGVGDAVQATAELRKRGRKARLRVIGGGDAEEFRQQAAAAGIANDVIFEGLRPHSEVLAAVRDAEIALIPSWHSYPEGLPLTIYEAFAVRTPIVCSDHPAFQNRVGNGISALCVPQRSPILLANAIEELLADPDRYHKMSVATEVTWSKLLCPVAYYELIRRWVANTHEDNQWLAQYSLASGWYD